MQLEFHPFQISVSIANIKAAPLSAIPDRSRLLRCMSSQLATQSGHGPYDRSTIGPKLQGKPALFEGEVLIVHLHVCHT